MSDLSDESVLVELRETFRGKPIFIRHDLDFYPADCQDGPETVKAVTIKIGYLRSEPKFKSTRSLSDCMDQVRAWAKERDDDRAVKGAGE